MIWCESYGQFTFHFYTNQLTHKAGEDVLSTFSLGMGGDSKSMMHALIKPPYR